MTCQGCEAPLHGMPLTGHALAEKKWSSGIRIGETTTCSRLTFIVTYHFFIFWDYGLTSLTNIHYKHEKIK